MSDSAKRSKPKRAAKKPPRAPRRKWPLLARERFTGDAVLAYVQLADLIIIASCGLVTYAAAVEPAEGWRVDFLAAGMVLALATLLSLHGYGAYRINHLRHAAKQLWRPLLACLTVGVATLAVLFFLKIGAQISRLWCISWLAGTLAGLTLFRFALQKLIARWTAQGTLARRAVLIGGGTPAADLIEALRVTASRDVRIMGVFDDRGDARLHGIPDYPVLGSFGDLVTFARRYDIDLLIVALPMSAERRLFELLRRLWVLPVDIRLSAQGALLRFTPRSYSYIGAVPFLDVFDKPLGDSAVAAKWLFDKTAGGLMLLAATPLMLVVALAVRLTSRGPVLFKQARYGFNNQLIEVYKFRSMYAELQDATAEKLVTRNDARVTPVGRFIRKTSLDELPQLFNVVFKGNLSLVGPRPHALAAKAEDSLYQDVVDGYFARHRVKPGITGWAQVAGWRGETNTHYKIQRRVEHDLYYIDHWSIWFDLYILLMTPVALFLDKDNAY